MLPPSFLFPPQALAAAEPPRGRILVCEDETVIALELQRMLRDAGYRVVGPAASVADARALIVRSRIDCAILDLDALPGRAARVADLLLEADIPFVLIGTSRETLPARHSDRKLVRKPCDPAELLKAVEETIVGETQDTIYPIAAAGVSFPRVMPQL